MINLMIVHFFGLISPGPDFFYVSRMAASNSHRNTVCGIIGITLGVAFWAAAAMLGLALVFSTMPMMHGAVMALGGGYLAYMGYSMVKVRENIVFDVTEQQLNQQTTLYKEIMKGLWINLSNAKAIIYFSSVMSLVLVNISQTWQILIALLIIVVETFCYFYLVALLFSRPFAKGFYSKYSRYIDNIAGLIFLIFGVYLVYLGTLKIIS